MSEKWVRFSVPRLKQTVPACASNIKRYKSRLDQENSPLGLGSAGSACEQNKGFQDVKTKRSRPEETLKGKKLYKVS